MEKYKKQIYNYIFNKSNKNNYQQLLGIEIEHIVLDNKNQSVLYYYEDGRYGIKDLLEDLSEFYENAHYSNYLGNNYIYELTRKDTEISLEPGAQLEVSFKPCNNISEIETYYSTFLNEIDPLLKLQGYHLANIGYRPDKCALEVPIIPRNRYFCMNAYFKNIDTHGPCMMRNSASAQISIDFDNEKDCKQKLKVGTALAPLIYFLYDNSPIFEKEQVGNKTCNISQSNLEIPKRMARYKVWQHTDSNRCMSLPFIFDKDFSIEKYIDYTVNLPLLFSPSKMKGLENNRLSIKFHEDNFYPAASPAEIIKNNASLTKDEILQILSFLFYDARLKNLIELRAADNMPKEFIYSYLALVKSLFYNKNNLQKIYTLFKNVNYEDYLTAGENLYNKGWEAEVYGYPITELLTQIFCIAQNGMNDEENEYFLPSKKLLEKKMVLKDYLGNQSLYITNDKSTYKPISKTAEYTCFQKKYFLENKGCENNKNLRYKTHLNSKAKFNNKIVDTGYFARIYDQNSMLQFEALNKILHKILLKVVSHYFKDKSYRKLWKWDDYSSKLINFCPAYDQLIPICRFDIFYDENTGQYNICEFNTGGTAAQSEVSFLSQDSLVSEPLKNLLSQSQSSIKTWELYKTWAVQFLNIYKNWSKSDRVKKIYKAKPNIAIVDILENSHIVDFYLFKDAFEELGCKCKICDVRKLIYQNHNLLDEDGNVIDAVYKRVTLNDFLPHKNNKGAMAFVDAVLNDDVCPIDWFSTQIVHDKQISYILNNEKTFKFLDNSEIGLIKCHIPYTERITKDNMTSNEFINNKNNYIVKPFNGLRSINVFSGKEFNYEEWKSILKKCANEDNFIIQSFCNQYTSPNILISQDNKDAFINTNYQKQIKAFSNMNGLYCYNGKLGGVWLRQGDHTENSIAYNVTCATFYEDNFNE